jgi:hypothetical protein
LYTYLNTTEGDPQMTNDAHHNEYLAAVAGIHDQTPRKNIYAEGDFVSGTTAGRRWAGYVEWMDSQRLCINVGGAWIYVPAADVLEASEWTESH